MIKACAHPFFCASTRCTCCLQRFDNLSVLLEYSDLTWDEKLLWLWIASQSAKKASKACEFSYQQISIVMNRTCKQVHRALSRLRVIGFLVSDLPIWYYELPAQMCTEVHSLTAVMPDKALFKKLRIFKDDPEGYVMKFSNN